jgi:hypothetical protein
MDYEIRLKESFVNPRVRQSLIFGALLATGLAAIFAPSPQDTVQPVGHDNAALVNKPVERIAAVSTPDAEKTPDAPPNAAMAPKKRFSLADKPKDLFYIEAPPKPVAVRAAPEPPPPPPMAPPLPYVYMGKSVAHGQVSVFLTRNDKPYVARQGDVLDGQYRIDAINPPILELTYLPLEQKQMLNIGAIK